MRRPVIKKRDLMFFIARPGAHHCGETSQLDPTRLTLFTDARFPKRFRTPPAVDPGYATDCNTPQAASVR